MLISETKNINLLFNLRNIRAYLEFNHLFTFEPLDFSGGLALFPMDEFLVNIFF